jgi:hypothetical protein
MRVIVRNLVILAATGAALVIADSHATDPHAEIVDRIASMTSALSNANPAGFMAPIDKNMTGYDTLRDYVTGMCDEAEVSSAVDPVKDEGDETKRSLELDWTLHLKSRQPAGPSVDREQTIHVEFVKEKKRWKIVSLSPIDFFKPTRFSLTQ